MESSKILVVEDESIVAMDIATMLLKLGHELIGTAMSGAAAMQMASETPPDLVLMDIGLKGGLDGIETAQLIRARHGSEIVFLTGYADTVTLQRAQEVSAATYLTKPIDRDELGTTIEEVLRGSQTNSEKLLSPPRKANRRYGN